MAHAFNLSTQGAEEGRPLSLKPPGLWSKFQDGQGYMEKPCLENPIIIMKIIMEEEEEKEKVEEQKTTVNSRLCTFKLSSKQVSNNCCLLE